MKTAVFPGSFDPLTLGHCDIIERGLTLFDEIVLAIGINADKKYMFSLEQRKAFLENTFKDYPNIKVTTYQELTVSYCKSIDAKYILRGLRNTTDFNYEQAIAQTNKIMEGHIESVFLMTAPELSHISSSIVRDVMRHNGKYEHLVPHTVRK
ncbi:MAG: pantetheine-phosphate adenylyltransferase [Gilvibacter sp.]